MVLAGGRGSATIVTILWLLLCLLHAASGTVRRSLAGGLLPSQPGPVQRGGVRYSSLKGVRHIDSACRPAAVISDVRRTLEVITER